MGGQVQVPPVPAKLLLDRPLGRCRAGQDQGVLLGKGRVEELADTPHFRPGAGQGPEARTLGVRDEHAGGRCRLGRCRAARVGLVVDAADGQQTGGFSLGSLGLGLARCGERLDQPVRRADVADRQVFDQVGAGPMPGQRRQGKVRQGTIGRDQHGCGPFQVGLERFPDAAAQLQGSRLHRLRRARDQGLSPGPDRLVDRPGSTQGHEHRGLAPPQHEGHEPSLHRELPFASLGRAEVDIIEQVDERCPGGSAAATSAAPSRRVSWTCRNAPLLRARSLSRFSFRSRSASSCWSQAWRCPAGGVVKAR